MRPVTDKYKVTRQKLAYIIDATVSTGMYSVTHLKLGGSSQYIAAKRQ